MLVLAPIVSTQERLGELEPFPNRLKARGSQDKGGGFRRQFADSSRVKKKTMHKFERQYRVDRRGVIPVAFDVATYNSLELFPLQVRPRERPRIKQRFPDVAGEGVPIPDPEMGVLVSAQEEAFQVKLRKKVIDPSYPRAHAVVELIFRPERDRRDYQDGDQAPRADWRRRQFASGRRPRNAVRKRPRRWP